MTLDVLISVVVTAAIQSVFGVGVLLFGTPILLLLSYDFVTTLTVLPLISVTINFIQIALHRRPLDVCLFSQAARPCEADGREALSHVSPAGRIPLAPSRHGAPTIWRSSASTSLRSWSSSCRRDST
jgi:hypothetical protein